MEGISTQGMISNKGIGVVDVRKIDKDGAGDADFG